MRSPTALTPREAAPTASFDSLAPHYRWLEYLTLGPLLLQTRKEYVKAVRDCRRALVLGDGDGRFLAAVMRQNPLVTADAVDTSGAMLALLRERCGKTERLRTHRLSALRYVPEKNVDLVATHFFLDCLEQTEVADLVERVAPALVDGGLWVISEFRVVGVVSRAYVRVLYLAFRMMAGVRVMRLPDYASALRGAGLVRIGYKDRLGGVLRAELWRKGGCA